MKSNIKPRSWSLEAAAIATCPDCGAKIVLQGAIDVGLGVRCPNCEADLQVVNLTPVELDAIDETLEGDQEIRARG